MGRKPNSKIYTQSLEKAATSIITMSFGVASADICRRTSRSRFGLLEHPPTIVHVRFHACQNQRRKLYRRRNRKGLEKRSKQTNARSLVSARRGMQQRKSEDQNRNESLRGWIHELVRKVFNDVATAQLERANSGARGSGSGLCPFVNRCMCAPL